MKSQILNEHQFGLFETSSKTQINRELCGIDQQSEKACQALEELAATYEYASTCVSHAFQTAQRMQDMQAPEEQSSNSRIDEQASFREYSHNVEQILDRLAAKLTEVIRSDSVEAFFQHGLYPLKSAWNDLFKEGKD